MGPPPFNLGSRFFESVETPGEGFYFWRGGRAPKFPPGFWPPAFSPQAPLGVFLFAKPPASYKDGKNVYVKGLELGRELPKESPPMSI